MHICIYVYFICCAHGAEHDVQDTSLQVGTNIYIYIYICMHVCVCMYVCIYIYIYIQ